MQSQIWDKIVFPMFVVVSFFARKCSAVFRIFIEPGTSDGKNPGN
jgi:hypothetical protein